MVAQRDISKLLERVIQLVEFRGFREFSSSTIAEILQVPKGDVLHCLHLLRGADRIKLLPGKGKRFSDAWRLEYRSGAYTYEKVETVLLADCR